MDDDASEVWKLKHMRDWELPGLRKLGGFLSIHSNASGVFDAEAYSTLVTEGVVEP